MSMFDDFENDVLDAMLGATATLLASGVEIGLSTTTPTEAGGNITEPSGAGYARVYVNNDGSEWPASTVGEKANANTLTFPQASGGNWGLVTHWVMYSSSVPVIWGILDDGAGAALPRQINDGDVFRFLAGQLRISLD